MIGKTISHYRILEKLGEGGMGVVYKAEDTRLHRTVALKFLRSEAVEDRELKARFRTEAEAAAALIHPNICVVHEVDEADGTSFIAMEYVEGESLAQKIRQRPLPMEQALDIGIQIAEGLQAAHEKGIVHRDVKSDNVLLTGRGQAKIMDFGLARLAGGTSITRAGTVLGTPAYMSPEQVRGEETDGRTDVWSLGVVLYEMVTGRLPFRGDTAQTVALTVQNQEPEPLTAVRTGVPVELDRIVSKALAKDPAERYQHVDELVVDLRRCRTPVKSGESSIRPSQPTSFLAKRRWLLATLAAMVAMVIGTAWHFLQQGSVSRPGQVSLAVLPLDNVSDDSDQDYFSDGMTEALTTQLAKIGALTVIFPTPAMRSNDTNLTLPEITRKLGVSHVLGCAVRLADGEVRITVRLIAAAGEHLLWTESYQRKMRDVLRLQEEVARAVAREVNVTLTPEESGHLASAGEVNPAAHEAYLKGIFFRNKWTAKGLQQAVQYFEQAIAEDPSDARAYAELAPCYLMAALSGAAPGTTMIPRAMETAGRALQLDPELAEAHAAMGHSQAFAWNWEQSEREFRRAIELNPGLPSPHAELAASCLAPQGRMEEAIDEINLAIAREPLSVRHLSARGGILRMNRQYEESIEALKEALSLDPNDALSHMRMAANYMSMGLWEQAVKSMERARELGRVCQPCMAAAIAGAGDTEEALRLLRSSKSRPPAAAAEAYVTLGDADSAFEALEQAYRERDPLLAYLKVYQVFDPLRSDPRYANLLKRLNLKP